VRYWASGAPAERVTVSSDGGGCLPAFDGDGRVVSMGVGDSGSLASTLVALLERGVPLARALAPFTANPAALLRLPRKGVVAVGADADLVVLDARGRPHEVMARGRWHVRGGVTVRWGTFERALGGAADGGNYGGDEGGPGAAAHDGVLTGAARNGAGMARNVP
jgi:beta-aspartyl-dipeptidase (metallo-type)